MGVARVAPSHVDRLPRGIEKGSTAPAEVAEVVTSRDVTCMCVCECVSACVSACV